MSVYLTFSLHFQCDEHIHSPHDSLWHALLHYTEEQDLNRIKEGASKWISGHWMEVYEVGREVLKARGMTPLEYAEAMLKPNFEPDSLSVYVASKFLKIHVLVRTSQGFWSTKELPAGQKKFPAPHNVALMRISNGFFLDLHYFVLGHNTKKTEKFQEGESAHPGLMAPSVDVLVELKRMTLSYDSSGTSTQIGSDSALDLSSLGSTSSTTTPSVESMDTETSHFDDLVADLMRSDSSSDAVKPVGPAIDPDQAFPYTIPTDDTPPIGAKDNPNDNKWLTGSPLDAALFVSETLVQKQKARQDKNAPMSPVCETEETWSNPETRSMGAKEWRKRIGSRKRNLPKQSERVMPKKEFLKRWRRANPPTFLEEAAATKPAKINRSWGLAAKRRSLRLRFQAVRDQKARKERKKSARLAAKRKSQEKVSGPLETGEDTSLADDEFSDSMFVKPAGPAPKRRKVMVKSPAEPQASTSGVQRPSSDDVKPDSVDDIPPPKKLNIPTVKASKYLQCSECTWKFATRKGYSTHLTAVHKRFLCQFCFLSYSCKKNRTDHEKKHVNPFTCDECGKRFSYECDMREHKKVHDDAKPFVCDQCNKAFKRKYDRNVHVKTVHATVKDSFQCEICDKTFATKQRLKQHCAIHGKNTHSCDFCSETFRFLQQLKRHLAKVHP